MYLFFQGNVDSNNKDIQPEDSSDDKLGDEMRLLKQSSPKLSKKWLNLQSFIEDLDLGIG